MNEIAVEAHNLTVAYTRRPVLWDVDFQVPSGKMIGVIGPNGSGKTTLLKSIMGLIEPVSGFIEIQGKPIEDIREKVGYVPQRESVDWDFPASVMDVALMGRYKKHSLLKRLTKKDKEIAKAALLKVGMMDFANRQISKLSGGQQQRVFLARALAQESDIYLMDEPFAGVDASSERAILEVLTDLKNEGKTLLIVHHDLQTAKEFFDWIILLNTRLVSCGPKDIALTDELLQQAYGGQLTVLSKMADIIQEKDFPIREKNLKDR